MATGEAWITTFTGRRFWPLEPRIEDVCIEDIAHALARQCRFSGHTRHFYSVAQHSVGVSMLVPPQYALWGLLHDAAEAYLQDMPRPLKHATGFGEVYQAHERQLMRVICKRFCLPEEEPDAVRQADEAMLCAEGRDLMTRQEGVAWANTTARSPWETVIPWGSDLSEAVFLLRFREVAR